MMTSSSSGMNSITELFVLLVYLSLSNIFLQPDIVYIYLCRSPTWFENSADLPQVLTTTSDDKLSCCLQDLTFPCSFFFNFTYSFPLMLQHLGTVLVPLSVLGHIPVSLLTAEAILSAALTEIIINWFLYCLLGFVTFC